MSSTECIICTERINKTTHKNVHCLYCGFDACRTCCERYILQEVATKCMNPKCDKEWTQKFMRDNFSLKFLNTEFKQKKENLLFEIEKTMFPSTQQIIENEKKAIDVKKELGDLYFAMFELNQAIINKKNFIKRLLNPELNEQFLQETVYNSSQNPDEAKEKKYVRKCTAPDCRGYVNSNWKCDLCENWTCKHCYEVKGKTEKGDHTCNPDMVASANLIKKDSRPCPACAIMIFKLEGCNQMFCTNCKTGFCWKTGKITKDAIHNPHYFDYIYRRDGSVPRNPTDVVGGACNAGLFGNRIETEDFDRRVYAALRQCGYKFLKKGYTNQKYDMLIKLVKETTQGLREINGIHIVRNRPDILINNRDIRLKYIKGEKPEAEFKKDIVLRAKKQEKKREMYNIYSMCLVAANDIFSRFLETNDISVFGEFDNLRIYANECIAEVNKTFSSASNERIDTTFKVAAYVDNGEKPFNAIIDMPNPPPNKAYMKAIEKKNAGNITNIYSNNDTPYLGFPKDESEWLKYVGNCIIFAGISETTYGEYEDSYDVDGWLMEPEEETKRRLVEGLKTVGVRCDAADITIKWTNGVAGERFCECVCYYNKPYQTYYSEFFIQGLSGTAPGNASTTPQLEFTFRERI